MNVRLSSEGAPVYMDQSPSYIYKNPPIEYNQNGVALPNPDKNAIVMAHNQSDVNATFIPHGDYSRKLATDQKLHTNTVSPKNQFNE